jgi:hypothetical protein
MTEITDSRDYLSATKRIILAVVIQAIRDARGCGLESLEARTWLLETGLGWLDIMNIAIPADFSEWVKAGCPARNKIRRSSTSYQSASNVIVKTSEPVVFTRS